MSSLYNGALQALIRKEQPLALYVHCVSLCINLATEAAVMQSSVIRNSLSLVNELGVLSSQSGKFQTIFKGAASSLYDKVVRLRPLCATRWTVRAKAIQHVLQQYESIVNACKYLCSFTFTLMSLIQQSELKAYSRSFGKATHIWLLPQPRKPYVC